MIYLDHAATSWPKPPSVPAAVQHWFEHVGVSADRGEGPRTREAAATVQHLRERIAGATGHPAARVAFCSGATEGLNLVLRGLLRQDMRVLTTPFEHSSVVRPLLALADERRLTIAVPDDGVEHGPTSAALCEAIARQAPALVVFTHASNVTGGCFDAAEICRTAREHGSLSVLDVSQTAGYLPLDVDADVVVASGHKALHGPPGIGFVTTRADLNLLPQKQGGTGSSTALDRHPNEWPQAFEAGTPNTPAIFGLAAALDWVDEIGRAQLLRRSLGALEQLGEGLAQMADIRVLAAGSTVRMPVLSFVHDRYDPLELGTILAAAGVHARTGFHCAPWLHRHLGTRDAGTARISTGPDTSAADIDTVLAVLRSL